MCQLCSELTIHKQIQSPPSRSLQFTGARYKSKHAISRQDECCDRGGHKQRVSLPEPRQRGTGSKVQRRYLMWVLRKNVTLIQVSNEECWAEKDRKQGWGSRGRRDKAWLSIGYGEWGRGKGKGRPQVPIWGTGWMEKCWSRVTLEKEQVWGGRCLVWSQVQKFEVSRRHELGDVQSTDGYLGDTWLGSMM